MPEPEPADPNDPLAATSRNLKGYQRQLQGLLENLTKAAAQATGQATGPRPVVLVTGAARRIGRAITLHLAAHGWETRRQA
jgi:type IV secretion system protein VirB10